MIFEVKPVRHKCTSHEVFGQNSGSRVRRDLSKTGMSLTHSRTELRPVWLELANARGRVISNEVRGPAREGWIIPLGFFRS